MVTEGQTRAVAAVLVSVLGALLLSGAIWRLFVSVDPVQPLDRTGRQLAATLARGPMERTVLIPAGWRLEQVAQAVELAHLGDANRFVALSRHPTPQLRRALSVRASSLEGYLAPGRYVVARGVGEQALLARMLARFWRGFSPHLRRRAQQVGLSTQEVVTLASLVQRETIFKSDMPPAAGVFLARLRAGMTLGSEPTITYAIDSARGVGGDATLYWRRRLSAADDRSSSPYNTYNHKGLPPGPIASPSIDAIEAVLFPARVPYRYFVAEPDGALAYARSLREHLANVRRYLSRGANGAVPAGPELQQVLDGLATAFPAHVGLVVKNLSTGEHAAVNAQDYFSRSSLYELLVMAAGYDEIRQGHIRMTDRVPIPPGAVALDPARTQAELGRAPTVTQAIREMITRSSNAAAFALVRKIGKRKIERFGRTLGLRDTWLTASQLLTTPADVARLLEAIADGRVVTRAASARMRALLGAQRLDNGLARSLPRGTRLEHMIGDFQTAHHDAGVVYTRRGRVLVVAMTEGMSNKAAASSAIALFGEVALNYFAPRATTVVAGKSAACSHGAFRPRASGPLSGRTIVLDPGHGGIDGGAVYSPAHGVRRTEKQFNLQIAMRLTELLTRDGATVYLTRCPRRIPVAARSRGRREQRRRGPAHLDSSECPGRQ